MSMLDRFAHVSTREPITKALNASSMVKDASDKDVTLRKFVMMTLKV